LLGTENVLSLKPSRMAISRAAREVSGFCHAHSNCSACTCSAPACFGGGMVTHWQRTTWCLARQCDDVRTLEGKPCTTNTISTGRSLLVLCSSPPSQSPAVSKAGRRAVQRKCGGGRTHLGAIGDFAVVLSQSPLWVHGEPHVRAATLRLIERHQQIAREQSSRASLHHRVVRKPRESIDPSSRGRGPPERFAVQSRWRSLSNVVSWTRSRRTTSSRSLPWKVCVGRGTGPRGARCVIQAGSSSSLPAFSAPLLAV